MTPPGPYRSWRDLDELAGMLEDLMEDRLPGELLRLDLEPADGGLLVHAEVSSETARSALLRHLACFPGVPEVFDAIVVTGYFEPARTTIGSSIDSPARLRAT